MIKFQYKNTEHTFYETWDEVPFFSFIEWQRLLPKLKSLETEIEYAANELNILKGIYIDQYILLLNGTQADQNAAKQLQYDCERKNNELLELQNKLACLEAEACSFFCSVPLSEMLSCISTELPKTSKNELDVDWNEYELDSNHIWFYKKTTKYTIFETVAA